MSGLAVATARHVALLGPLGEGAASAAERQEAQQLVLRYRQMAAAFARAGVPFVQAMCEANARGLEVVLEQAEG